MGHKKISKINSQGPRLNLSRKALFIQPRKTFIQTCLYNALEHQGTPLVRSHSWFSRGMRHLLKPLKSALNLGRLKL